MTEKTVDKKFYINSYGNVFGDVVATPIGRATFVHLTSPNTKYKPEKYGLHILFKKDDDLVKEGLRQIQAICKRMAEQKFGDKIPSFSYPPFRDGDEQKYQGFSGCYYIKCSSSKKPEIVDTKKKGLDAALVAPGVLVRAVVTPILFDSGFSYQLTLVQFVKDDGVRYYGGPDPKSLLSALDEPSGNGEPSVEQSLDKAIASSSGKKAALGVL